MVMAESFNSYKELVDLSPLIELIRAEGRRVAYRRGEYLLHEGEVERRISVVLSGYCRFVTTRSDGSESVVGFSLPGDIAVGFSDGIYRIPSRLSIIASSRVEVVQLPFSYAFAKMAERDQHLTLKMERALSRTLLERHLDLYKLTPAERYHQFVASHPDIFEQIQIKELASFLQITPQHLYRIKRIP